MAERDVWKALRKSWNVPGKIRRIEAKSNAGFVDVLACAKGLTYFIELKHIMPRYEVAPIATFLGGLKGVQALELSSWARAGAPAYLVIGYGKGPFEYAIYEGKRFPHLYEISSDVSAGRIRRPLPSLFFRHIFKWEKLLQHHESLTTHT